MIRTGSCNRCGQCCGADGSPQQANPFPKNWITAMRNWLWADVVSANPLLEHMRPPDFGGDASMSFRIGNKRYRVIWVDGRPLKDLPPYGDPTSCSLECPLLMDDPGDGTRPCALVGTQYESVWETMCQSEPPIEKTPEQVVTWYERHPLCSYVYIEE